MHANFSPNQGQDAYLYEGDWSKEIDFLFIEVICFQQKIGNFTVGAKNYSAIGLAIDTINRKYGKHFSYKFCELRVKHLLKRYKTFSWLLSLTEVMYDEVTKHMHAPNRIWDFIIQRNPFAMAYRQTGDPSWFELQDLFGYIEPEPNVIVLSSEESEDDVPNHEAPLSGVLGRPSTTSSRNKQLSIWDFVGYETDEDTMHTNESSSKRKILRSKKKKASVAAPTPMMEEPRPGHSCASSCASNDPYGKRPVP